MAFGLIPNSAAALLAALAMIAGGCVRLDAIYRIISWKTVVLIAGMLPLATALIKTGATDLMARELVAASGSSSMTNTVDFVSTIAAASRL